MQKNMEMNSEDDIPMELVATFTFHHELAPVLSLLEANGIACYVKDEFVVQVDPFLSNAVGGIKLQVKKENAAAAAQILHEAEMEYLNTVVCTTCKKPGLRKDEKTDRPDSFGKKLLNKLLFGQSTIYSKKYICNSCGAQFSEIPVTL